MRVTRVFVEAPLSTGAQLALPAGPAGHVVRVLRLGPGDALRLFNGTGGEFEATIDAVRRDAVSVRVGAHHAVERESPLSILLLQGIARGEKMDLVLQKATELGASGFVPLMMARSTVRLDERTACAPAALAGGGDQRLQQCGRNTVPAVAAPTPFQKCAPALGCDCCCLGEAARCHWPLAGPPERRAVGGPGAASTHRDRPRRWRLPAAGSGPGAAHRNCGPGALAALQTLAATLITIP
jgi:hypothetical protein